MEGILLTPFHICRYVRLALTPRWSPSFSPTQKNGLLSPKWIHSFQALGGIYGMRLTPLSPPPTRDSLSLPNINKRLKLASVEKTTVVSGYVRTVHILKSNYCHSWTNILKESLINKESTETFSIRAIEKNTFKSRWLVTAGGHIWLY